MLLQQLEVTHLRNLTSLKITPSPKLTVITGKNGSGKTSILESIYLLGHGKSFRTTHIKDVIQQDQNEMICFGLFEKGTQRHKIGISRKRVGDGAIRVDGNNISGSSQLARMNPMQVITPQSDELIVGSPRHRRQYLDWLMFHVEPTFHQTWSEYIRVLKQRNAALKRYDDRKSIELWNQPLAEYGERITDLRSAAISRLIPFFRNESIGIQMETIPELEFKRGWSGDSLIAELESNFDRDKRFGTTQSGPHRADIAIYHNRKPARDVLSRGQIKVTITALKLAQITMAAESLGSDYIVLFDDLGAELDTEHREWAIERLKETGVQTFVTTPEPDLIPGLSQIEHRMFHVEHGSATEVVY